MLGQHRGVALTTILTAIVLLISSVFVFSQHHAGASPEGEREQVVHDPRTGAACGVERWSVKTGTDSGARAVNLRSIYQTSIASLTALNAPGTLPAYSRIRPTESRVYSLSTTLIRFKMEADSDYHLVISDGSRTMIAEIPSPSCVGSNSPFLPAIRAARKAFDARYKVEPRMRYVRTKLSLVGVGYFDFLHGQSGVAPNGIELHPVLSVQFAGGKPPVPAPPPSRPTKKRPAPRPSGSFYVRAFVSPSTMPYDAYPTLTAQSARGANCSASVVYSTGRSPVSFNGSPQTVGGSGSVSWSWHEETKGDGGTASVSCTYGSQSKSVDSSFTVTH